MYYIYGYLNKITNKWYVGQTTLPLKERHRLHLSGAKNKKASDYNCLFHKKIRQYGIENFELSILENVPNKKDLDEREKYWISQKKSFVRDSGYNLTTGGQIRKNNENYLDNRTRFQSEEEILSVISTIKNSDLSLTDISKKYNVSLSEICFINSGKKYHSDTENYPLRPLKIKIDQDTVKLVISLLEENYSNSEISKLLEIDNDIVYRINYGLAHKQINRQYPIRKEISEKEKRAQKIKKLLKENKLNNKEIANLVGCDPSVVSNINYGKNYKDDSLTYPIRIRLKK